MHDINWVSVGEEVIGGILALIIMTGCVVGFFIAKKAWRSAKQKLWDRIDVHIRVGKKG